VSIASKILENKELKLSLMNINADLKGGKKLSRALSKSPYVPKIVLQMLEIGEESGNVGEMLAEVAEQLEKDMKLKIKRLLALFEPACILFLAVVVLTVVISIFMAIMEMNNI
jgi:type II secretory pathway component PulF